MGYGSNVLELRPECIPACQKAGAVVSLDGVGVHGCECDCQLLAHPSLLVCRGCSRYHSYRISFARPEPRLGLEDAWMGAVTQTSRVELAGVPSAACAGANGGAVRDPGRGRSRSLADFCHLSTCYREPSMVRGVGKCRVRGLNPFRQKSEEKPMARDAGAFTPLSVKLEKGEPCL